MATTPQSQHLSHRWVIFVDGASRGNPGLAGAGVHITYAGKQAVSQGFFLGICTNNEAEYSALVLALCMVRDYIQPNDTIQIFSDSQLLVRQLCGEYRVRQPVLVRLHQQVMLLLQGMRYSVEHVMRSSNKRADALANEGIDHRYPIPEEWRVRCFGK